MQFSDPGSDHEDRSPSDSQGESGVSGLYPMRILIIDDGEEMPGVLQHLSDGIDSGKYEVTRASTIADGFGAMVNETHDVYIVDHHIGVRTGFDLLARVNAEGLRLPIIFVAGKGDHGSGVTAVGAGASCYVVKDTADSAILDHCLRHAVEQRQALSRLTDVGVSIDGGSPTKAQILSHIAGRMRTPATAMLEAARHSMGYDLPGYAVDSFAHIEDQAISLLTLANDLADLASLESGRLEFDTAPFDLRGLISNVEKLLASSTESPSATLESEIAAAVPESVIGDPGRLRLAILRFVENVIGRSSSDRVRMLVDVEDHGPETVTLHFQIDAVGQELSHGGETATASAVNGLDEMLPQRGVLGMPVALETVSRMGGRVSVNDEPGQTATISFVVRLQVSKTETPQRPVAEETEAPDQPILIIADAVEDRRSIVKALAQANLPYVVASNVRQWIESMQAGGHCSSPPALAVIASTEDSFDTCDRLTELAPITVPMVVVTKSGQRGDAARCRDRGVKGYLSEPMEPSDLVGVVKASLALVESGDTSTLVTRHWLREGLRSLRVLVTDDSYTSRFLMTRMLEHRGHSAATASDGGEAVEALEQGSFDVVLMDVMMPVMDGLEATRRIRAMHNGSGNGPTIIGMSAIGDKAAKDRGREAGMDGFLTKPVHPDDLFAIIERETVSETA